MLSRLLSGSLVNMRLYSGRLILNDFWHKMIILWNVCDPVWFVKIILTVIALWHVYHLEYNLVLTFFLV